MHESASDFAHATTTSQREPNLLYDAQTLTPSSSVEDLDHARLGRLERHELEQLLIEASRKMREREAKLVVAANIGKALLEKNLSLRSGIETSIASSSSLFGLSDIEAMISDLADPTLPDPMLAFHGPTNDTPSPPLRPIYSPPTTDVDVHSQAHRSPSRAASDTTPTAHPVSLPDFQPDYFSRPANDTTSPPAASTFSIQSSIAFGDRAMWVPSDAGLIASQPCSPSASISSFASHALLSSQASASRNTSNRGSATSRHRSRPSLLQLQALEAQKQLASLGEQNDVLHQQISDLQREAECARFEGSKKLSRLNKELRGLKAELEAATQRNLELETNHSASRSSPGARSAMRRLVLHDRQVAPPPQTFPTPAHHQSSLLPLAPPSTSTSTSPEQPDPKPDRSGLIPSTSNLEDMVRCANTTAGESALLAQLLAKVKELEETNTAMARAEEEFGSRMGRAMQEDERLRDAFNTVGQDLAVESAALESWSSPDKVQKDSNVSLLTPAHSVRSLTSLASAHTSSPLSSMSPSQKRRAPGNRHVIEHRKTVRMALRRAKKELAANIWGLDTDPAPVSSDMSRSSTEKSLGTYSIDLSANSSVSSSPRTRGLNRKFSSTSMALGLSARPRIRITPSIEDLGQRRKMHQEVIAGPEEASTSQPGDWQDLTTPTLANFPQFASLSPTDAMKASPAHLQVGIRPGRTSQNSPRREFDRSAEEPLSEAEPRSSLSPSSQTSFNPTARVRRSRTRSSSFSSNFYFPRASSSVEQSPDPFMSPAAALNRPGLHRNPSSGSSHRGRTLGSELGSIFGGDDRKHDFDDDLPQRRRLATTMLADAANSSKVQSLVLHRTESTTALELRSKLGDVVESDRPTANVGRLVPQSDDEQQDDLEYVLTQSVCDQVEDVFLEDSPLRPRDAALLARVEAEESGMWLADQPIIETGGLQDQDEPRSAQFDLINAVIRHQAVAWADDDDYGRTISQREAVKLGLLAPNPSSRENRNIRLLKGKSKHAASDPGIMQAQQATGARKASFRLEIESCEQLERRLRIESLLRRRRQELLRERGFLNEWETEADVHKQEAEFVATYAPSPQRLQERRLKALSPGKSDMWSTSPQRASLSNRDSRLSTQEWVRDLASVSPSRQTADGDRDDHHDDEENSMSLDCVRPEDTEFEMLDCPSWKKQGGRGTDYFPTSFRARYRPAMVKQRVAHVSQVTYGWVEEWVQFAFVVFLAFMVMVEQGPNRNNRREMQASKAQQYLLKKAE